MFSKFFKESYLKSVQEHIRFLHKKHKYDHDILNQSVLDKINSAIKEFSDFQSKKLPDEQGSTELARLENKHSALLSIQDRGWKENVEVIFVALVIALAVKAYFFQPFRIPTHSMRPTLLGILSEERIGETPGFPVQVMDFFLKGRTYHRVVARNSGKITGILEQKIGFLSFTKIFVGNDEYKVWSTLSELYDAGYSAYPNRPSKHSLVVGTSVEAGQELVNFTVEMGDYVFVNKMTYHFRLPERGEVFVFTTRGIMRISQNGVTSEGSQYYIKRCVGVGGDTLMLKPPFLYNQLGLMTSPAFERIYSLKNGYSGYVYPVKGQAQWLVDQESNVVVPHEAYWAMGDNSPNSFDSRYWGPVARENLVGTGFMVAWPFTGRWGLIH